MKPTNRDQEETDDQIADEASKQQKTTGVTRDNYRRDRKTITEKKLANKTVPRYKKRSSTCWRLQVLNNAENI